MAVLPLAAWVLGFLILAGLKRPLAEAALASLTVVSVCVLLTTELLSAFSALSFAWVALSWLVLCAAGVLLFHHRVVDGMRRLDPRRRPDLSRTDIVAGAVIAVFVGAAALAALLYPTTNYDSLTYHMPRVFFWYQNQSVAHYPTAEARQLFSSPFVEYVVLNLKVLSHGSERLSNLVQWTSYAASIAAVSLVARQLGATRRGQQAAALAAATVPMSALQASTTQNDLTCALWCLVAVYAMLSALSDQPSRQPFLIARGAWIGAALALAVASKPTAYLFCLPFVAWFAITSVRRLQAQRAATLAATALLVFAVLGVGWYARTAQTLDGDFLATSAPSNAHILVRDTSLEALTTNALKNSSMQLGTPSPSLNRRAADIVRAIVRVYGGDIENPRTKESPDQTFELDPRVINHDVAPAPLTAALLLIAGATLYRSRKTIGGPVIAYAAAALIAWFFITASITWNHYINRVTLGALMLALPLVGVAATSVGRTGGRLLRPLLVLTLAASVGWCATAVAFSSTNRLISAGWVGITVGARDIGYWNVAYDDLIFRIMAPEYEDAFKAVASAVKTEDITRVGLNIRSGDFRIHPLLVLLDDYRVEYVGNVVLPDTLPTTETDPEVIIDVIPLGEYSPYAAGSDAGARLLEPQRAGDVVIVVRRGS